MKKRWFALLLALTLVLGTCPAALAASAYGREGAEVEAPDPEPGEGEDTPEEDPGLTVVLGIGYHKMAVGDEVVQVDDRTEEVCPLEREGRTLVPVGPIVAAFGGQVTWDEATDNTTYTLGERRVEHVIGAQTVAVIFDGLWETKVMEVPSVLLYDRTYVPARYVLEGLGLWVGWEPTYELVVVSTKDLSGQDLIELSEAQRLFASEEVPDTPRAIIEGYAADGGAYTVEVGEALSLYNPRQAMGTYYAYTWEVVDGGELVSKNPQGATCQFYAKRSGVVTLKAHLDETVVLGQGSFRNITTTYTMTITVISPDEGGGAGSLMRWETCPTCNGAGSVREGSLWETCPTCLGQKQVLR